MTPTLCQVTFPFGPLTLGFAKEILRNLSYFPSGSICSFHEHMARVHWRKLLARGSILPFPRFGMSAVIKNQAEGNHIICLIISAVNGRSSRHITAQPFGRTNLSAATQGETLLSG